MRGGSREATALWVPAGGGYNPLGIIRAADNVFMKTIPRNMESLILMKYRLPPKLQYVLESELGYLQVFFKADPCDGKDSHQRESMSACVYIKHTPISYLKSKGTRKKNVELAVNWFIQVHSLLSQHRCADSVFRRLIPPPPPSVLSGLLLSSEPLGGTHRPLTRSKRYPFNLPVNPNW